MELSTLTSVFVGMFFLSLSANFLLVFVLLGNFLQQRKVLNIEEKRARLELRRFDVLDWLSKDQEKTKLDVEEIRLALGYLFHYSAGLTISSPLNDFMKEKHIHRWYSHKG